MTPRFDDPASINLVPMRLSAPRLWLGRDGVGVLIRFNGIRLGKFTRMVDAGTDKS